MVVVEAFVVQPMQSATARGGSAQLLVLTNSGVDGNQALNFGTDKNNSCDSGLLRVGHSQLFAPIKSATINPPT